MTETLLKTRDMALAIFGEERPSERRLRHLMRELREAALMYQEARSGWSHHGCTCSIVNRRYRFRKADGLAWAIRTGRAVAANV